MKTWDEKNCIYNLKLIELNIQRIIYKMNSKETNQ